MHLGSLKLPLILYTYMSQMSRSYILFNSLASNRFSYNDKQTSAIIWYDYLLPVDLAICIIGALVNYLTSCTTLGRSMVCYISSLGNSTSKKHLFMVCYIISWYDSECPFYNIRSINFYGTHDLVYLVGSTRYNIVSLCTFSGVICANLLLKNVLMGYSALSMHLLTWTLL